MPKQDRIAVGFLSTIGCNFLFIPLHFWVLTYLFMGSPAACKPIGCRVNSFDSVIQSVVLLTVGIIVCAFVGLNVGKFQQKKIFFALLVAIGVVFTSISLSLLYVLP